MCHWSELIGNPTVVGEALPKLKRGQGSRHLGVDMALVPEEEEAAGGYIHRNKYFTSSGRSQDHEARTMTSTISRALGASGP